MDISKGEFNDFSPNQRADEIASPLTPAISEPVKNQISSVQPQASEVNGFVEVTAKVPHTDTKVTITIEVEPGKKKLPEARSDVNTSAALTTEDRYSRLLFVTSCEALQNNISESSLLAVKNFLQQKGAEVLNIAKNALSTAEGVAAIVRQRLLAGGVKGVVILGGYDIIPAQKVDVLFPDLRKELLDKKRITSDADDFIIWSDDIYGDINMDSYPELPVSRIPDGKDEQLMLKALTAPVFAVKSRFGVRNLARPFAQGVYQDIPGDINQMEISESFSPQDVVPDSAIGAVYYMLHGSDRDGTRFWGETADEEEFEAFSIENIPGSAPGTVVFTGCCWGALPAEPIAFRTTLNTPMRPRTPEKSIALKYLQAGALAFVGSTGSHYSPREEPYYYHGKPMHDHFWKAIKEETPPAQALFKAKVKYRNEYPHGETAPFSKAIELKTLRQFTCLGLGW